MFQIGGGNCSICKSPNTNKSTCPCNPDVVSPNYKKHPLCLQKNKKNGNKPIITKKSPKKSPLHKNGPSPMDYLANLPLPALESLAQQGLLEDLTSLRQSSKAYKTKMDQPSIKKIAHGKNKYIPSANMILQLNDMASKLNNLVETGEMETYWVDELPQKYRLTMKDVEDIRKGKIVWVFQPQVYDEIMKFDNSDSEQLSWFYDFEGNAVTGSGADTWGLYRPGMLDEMEKIYHQHAGHFIFIED